MCKNCNINLDELKLYLGDILNMSDIELEKIERYSVSSFNQIFQEYFRKLRKGHHSI